MNARQQADRHLSNVVNLAAQALMSSNNMGVLVCVDMIRHEIDAVRELLMDNVRDEVLATHQGATDEVPSQA